MDNPKNTNLLPINSSINAKKATRSASMISSKFPSSKIVPFQPTNPNSKFQTEQNSRICPYSYNNVHKSKSI